MNVAIVIIHFNNYQLTHDCINSIQTLVIPESVNLQTIIVDNHSHNNSADKLANKFPDITLVKSTQNLGFTGGNNLGVQMALQQQAEWVLLLNNDTVVDKNLMRELLNFVKRHPAVGIAAPKIYFAPGYEFHKDRYTKQQLGKVIWFAGGEIDWANMYGSHIGVDEVDTGQYDQPRQIELASGCCMLIHRDLFSHNALFDDRYFMYYEDTDLCIRTQLSGQQIWYVPTAKLWHVNAGSSSSGSSLQDYFITRNRLMLGMFFAPLRTKFALLREAIRLLIRGRTWQRRGVVDFFLHRYGPGSYPIKP